MRKKTKQVGKGIIFIIGIIAISFVSSYYAGETHTFENEFGSENLMYTIIDNETIVNLGININNQNISIHFPSDMQPQSLTIIFMDEQTKEIVQEIRVGGGGGTRKVVEYENNTIFVNKIVEKECENSTSLEGDKIEESIPLEEDKNEWWRYLLVGIIIIGLFFMGYFIGGLNEK